MNDGTISVSPTSTDWDNNKSIINVIYSIYDLLKMPSTAHGLIKEALQLYHNDYESFKKKLIN